MNRMGVLSAIVAAYVVGCAGEGAGPSAQAEAVSARANPNPGVLPPHSNPHGASYGEWGARWWQWFYKQPRAVNVAEDTTGAQCGRDQSGPVWFLAGTFGTAVNRTCTIPQGKSIFFPLVNQAYDYPCPPEFGFEPPPGQSLEDFLRAGVRANIDLTDALSASIDGRPLRDLFAYRGTSGLRYFTGDLSWQGWDACVTGRPQPFVSDGYWLMLAPLSRGRHTLHFTANIDEWGFALDTTYTLDVR